MDEKCLQERESEVVAEFRALGDWIARYEHLVSLGDAMPQLVTEMRTEENYILGCQSSLWIYADYDPDADAVHFQADSDARITRGMAALVIRVLDGQSPEAIVDAKLEFLDAIGLRTHLSAQRRNGLAAMIHWMKNRARAFLGDRTNGSAAHQNGTTSE